MKLFIVILLNIYLLSSYIRAGEVDPFYALNKEILDSKTIINRHLNNSLRTLLTTYDKEQSSCKDVALFLMQEIGTTDYFITKIGALNSDLEIWVNNNKDIDRVPKYGYDNDLYTKQSIYTPQLKIFHIYPKEVDSSINIDGVYFGIDKLSHFLGSGYEYYKIYLEKKEDNFSQFTSEFSAIKWGIEMENTILGLWAVGIFSYADLEANVQGLKMAQDLCSKPLLKHKDKRCQLIRDIKIQEYVNPYWNEAYNPSSYTKEREEEIKHNIANIGICQKTNWKFYKKQFDIYDKSLKNSEFNLSRTILSSFLTQDRKVKERLYDAIIKHYQLNYSHEKLAKLFNELKKVDKASRLENYCSTKP